MNIITYLCTVYNSEKYILELLESFENQTCKEFDILFIDDGSTDGTGEILKEFMANRNYCRVITLGRNMGVTYCLNLGFQIIKSEWIARIDSDDVLDPERTANTINSINNNKDATLIYGNVRVIGSKSRAKVVKLPRPILTKIFLSCGRSIVFHPSVTMKRERILRMGGYPLGFIDAEDYALWLRIIDERFVRIDSVLINYRLHDQQISYTRVQKSLESRYKALEYYYIDKLARDKVLLNSSIWLVRLMLRLEVFIVVNKHYGCVDFMLHMIILRVVAKSGVSLARLCSLVLLCISNITIRM